MGRKRAANGNRAGRVGMYQSPPQRPSRATGMAGNAIAERKKARTSLRAGCTIWFELSGMKRETQKHDTERAKDCGCAD